MSKISRQLFEWFLSIIKNIYFWIAVVLLFLPLVFDKVFNVFFNKDITMGCYILGAVILFNKFVAPLEWFQITFGDMIWRAANWPSPEKLHRTGTVYVK